MPGPLVNGVSYAWATIKFAPFGVPIVGILNIEYERKQDKKNNYGAGKEPISRGYGINEYDGSIELYLEEWKNIIAASPNRDPLLIPWFDIPVIYGDSIAVTTTDNLRAVEFLKDPFSGKQGDTKLTVKIPLIIGRIDR